MKTSAPEPNGLDRRAPLRAQLHRAWARVRGGELTPARVARSIALGLFVGVLPVPGLHLPMVLAVALPLRLDGALAYLAANISIPPLAPFLWVGALQLGSLARGHGPLPLSLAGARTAMRAGAGPLIATLALGSVLLGTALATLGGVLGYFIARALRARRAAAALDPRFAAAVTRTAARYERATRRRGTYYYVRGKLGGDPAARAVFDLGPLGEVLDLGCGRGQLAVLLLEGGVATRVVGRDWDDEKASLASRAGAGLAAEFARGDVRAIEASDSADAVLLIDVLHYFDRATQDALLLRAAGCVRPGGVLVLREADTGRGLRSWITRLFEGVGTAVRFNRGERVLFRDVAAELIPLLESAGLSCELRPCWAGTPFANVLVTARRPRAHGPAN